MKSFEEGTRELAEKVGRGTLVGTVEVDQVYAAPQNAGYWVTGPLAGVVIKNHPQGGGSHFLDGPLFERAHHYLANLSDAVLSGFLVQAMAENMEDLSQQVFENAPREFEDLRNSGHPSVESDGRIVYDRAPVRSRLSRAALDEKAKRRSLGEGPRRGGETLPFRA